MRLRHAAVHGDTPVFGRGIAAVLLGIATVVFGTSCGFGCTDVGCQSLFAVKVRAQAWPSADYRFELATGGHADACILHIPAPCVSPPPSCYLEAQRANVTVYPCEDDAPYVSIEFDGTPKRASVAIHRGGELLAEKRFEPEYDDYEIAGSCDAECSSASDSIDVAP